MRKVPPAFLIPAVALAGLALTPVAAEAQELTLYYGKFLGGDVVEDAPLISPGSVQFEDTAALGTRIAPFGNGSVEVSFMYTGSSVFPGTEHQADVRIMYAEANVLIGLLPGPVRPFLTTGIGFHRFAPQMPEVESFTELGYNVGAGVKVGLGGLGLRVDLRDHITPLDIADLSPAAADFFDLQSSTIVHNVELSMGLSFKF